MGYRIRCKTLFDVTKTGIQIRNKPVDMDYDEWIFKRNTQCNLDTILQSISLRSLPEIYDDPVLKYIDLDNDKKFGYAYVHNDKNHDVPCWLFEFYVQDISVFYDGIHELGALYNDCHQVPMIKCSSMHKSVRNFLDTSSEFRNIYFEVVKYEP